MAIRDFVPIQGRTTIVYKGNIETYSNDVPLLYERLGSIHTIVSPLLPPLSQPVQCGYCHSRVRWNDDHCASCGAPIGDSNGVLDGLRGKW